MNEKVIADALGLRSLEEIRAETKDDATLPDIFYEDGEILDPVSDEPNETIDDINFAKNNVKGIIDNGNKAIKELMALSSQAESARAYEVVATMMKTMLDASKEYVDLAVKKKYEKEDVPKTATTNVTNNNLVISTSELLKLMKGDKNE